MRALSRTLCSRPSLVLQVGCFSKLKSPVWAIALCVPSLEPHVH